MWWTTFLCNKQITYAMNNLIVQWTTYLCNKQLTCVMKNLLVQWTPYLCYEQLSCAIHKLLMQWTTYLCNEQLTCAMNNLLVQWTTYWCNEQLTCAMNNLLVQWIISQIFESTLSQFFYLTNTTLRLFFYLKHGQTWVGFCRSVFFVKYFYFFTKKLTVQKYLLLLALSEHELQAQEYVIKVVLFSLALEE